MRRRLEQWTHHRVSVGSVTINSRLQIVAQDVRIAGAPPFDSETLAFAHRVIVRLRGPAGFWSPSEVTVEGLDIDYLGSMLGDNVRPPPSGGISASAARAKTPGAASWPRLVVRHARLRGSLALSHAPRLEFRVPDAELKRETNGIIDVRLRGAVVDVDGWASVRAAVLTLRSPAPDSADGRWTLTSQESVSVEVPGGGALLDKLALAATLGHGNADVELREADNRAEEKGEGPPGPLRSDRPSAAGQSSPSLARILSMHLEPKALAIALNAKGLVLRPLASVAMKAGLGVDHAQASFTASVTVDRVGLQTAFSAQGKLSGVDVLHAAVDVAPWRNQSLMVDLAGTADLLSKRVDLANATVKALGATAVAKGWFETGPVAKGSVVAETPKQAPLSCTTLLRAQAEPVRRALAGFELGGALGFRLSLDFDAGNWDELRLGIDVNPRCSVIREPDALATLLPLLKKPKSEPPPSATLALGPYHPDFTPLSRMPPHLPSAFITAEDSKFFRHHGFDTEMIQHVLAQDLENRSFDRGASTITQQLAKNLFLSHRRTLARKLEEAVLTWRLQRLLSKDRTLELYLNVIELGPGIRGVKRAAQLYFGKDVEQLSPLESAHLAALTPNPHVLARRFRDGQVDESWQQRLYDLLGMMKRHGRLSSDELAHARNETLVLRDLGKK